MRRLPHVLPPLVLFLLFHRTLTPRPLPASTFQPMKMPLRFLLLFLVTAVFAAGAEVRWLWAGGVTPHSVRLKVKYADADVPALRVGVDPALRSAREVKPVTTVAAGDGWVADYQVDGLTADTLFHYGVGETRGRVRTFPAGPASFTVALGSCAQTGSTHPVFEAIARHEPLLFLHNGDLHYENIAVNDINAFRAAYAAALGSATQAVLYRSTAVNYIWDDHDFGPNNSDGTSPSREASRAAYREMVPHYPLVDEGGAIHHAFTIGRVRFIVSDTRSERDPPSVPEGPERTMMGAKQKAWLKQELLAARDTAALIVWVNSVPWIGTDTGAENEDRWTGFPTERAELAAFIEQNGIHNLCVVSGDAHMVAIDDGTNNRYGPGKRPLFPVFHAAALDRKGSVKGGPYSHGAFGGPGQFGLLRVTDDGGPEIRVELSGRTHEDVVLVRHAFTLPVPGSRR